MNMLDKLNNYWSEEKINVVNNTRHSVHVNAAELRDDPQIRPDAN